MNILLDTHIFLWYISGDEQMPEAMRHDIQEMENDIYLSVVSLWEVIIKYQLGKLALPQTPDIYLPQQRRKHLIKSLDVDEESVKQLATLPALHRDPFDRLLICQAMACDLVIATADRTIEGYDVATL